MVELVVNTFFHRHSMVLEINYLAVASKVYQYVFTFSSVSVFGNSFLQHNYLLNLRSTVACQPDLANRSKFSLNIHLDHFFHSIYVLQEEEGCGMSHVCQLHRTSYILSNGSTRKIYVMFVNKTEGAISYRGLLRSTSCCMNR